MKTLLREIRLIILSPVLSFIHFIFPFFVILIHFLSPDFSGMNTILMASLPLAFIIPVNMFVGINLFPLKNSHSFYKELGTGGDDMFLILTKAIASFVFCLCLLIPWSPEIFYYAELFDFDRGLLNNFLFFWLYLLFIAGFIWIGISLFFKSGRSSYLISFLVMIALEIFLFSRSWTSSLVSSGFILIIPVLFFLLVFSNYLQLRKIRKGKYRLSDKDNKRIIFLLAIVLIVTIPFVSQFSFDISEKSLISPSSSLINNFSRLEDPVYFTLPENLDTPDTHYFLRKSRKKSNQDINVFYTSSETQLGIRYRNQFYPISRKDLEKRLDSSLNRIIDQIVYNRGIISIQVLYRNDEEKEDPWMLDLAERVSGSYHLEWIQEIPQEFTEKTILLVRNGNNLNADEIGRLYYWQQSGGDFVLLLDGLALDPVETGRAEEGNEQNGKMLINELWGVRAVPTLIRENSIYSEQAFSSDQNRFVDYPFWFRTRKGSDSVFQVNYKESRILWGSPLEFKSEWKDQWKILQTSSFQSDTVQSTSFSLIPGGSESIVPSRPGGESPYAAWYSGEAINKGDVVIWGTTWSFSSYADSAGGFDNDLLLLKTFDLLSNNSSVSLADKYISSDYSKENPDFFRYDILFPLLINLVLFLLCRLLRRKL